MKDLLRLTDRLIEAMPPVGWLLLAILGAIGIIFTGTRPAAELGAISHMPHGMDKVMHFTAYGGLAVLLFRWRYPVRVSIPPRGMLPWLPAILFPSLLGMLDEFLQGYTPGRSQDIYDWMADTSAGIVMCLVALAMRSAAIGRQRSRGG